MPATRSAPRSWSAAMVVALLAVALPVAGWLVSDLKLASLGPGRVPMAPATALGLLLLLATVALRRWAPLGVPFWRATVVILPAAAALEALLILAPVVLGVPIYLEQWIFPAALRASPRGIGLVSELSAVLLLAEAAYLLLLRFPDPQPVPVGLLGCGVVAAAVGLLIGYMYGAPYLYGTQLVPPSLPTSIALATVGLAALLTSGRATWPARLFIGVGIQSRLLRRLFPIVLTVILAHAWIVSLPALRLRDRAVLSAAVLLGALIVLLAAVTRATETVARDADRAMGERLLAEAALDAERSVLRNLIDHLPFAVFIKDRDSRFVVANEFTARVLGVASPGDLVGRRDFDFAVATDAVEHHEREQVLIRTGEPLRYVTGSPTVPGESVFRHSKYPLKDAQGAVTGLIGVVEDLTDTLRTQAELQQATTALQEREELHRILFDAAADAMLFHDEQSVLLDVNSVACTRLGYTREELVGRPLSMIISPAHAARIADRMTGLLERGSGLYESEHVARDGRIIPVEVHARVVEYAGRRVVFSVSRDITERKNAEAALRAQEAQARQGQKMEAIGRLAGGVAHDFNNILTVISGYSDLLLEILGDTHPARNEVREIRTAAERASSLTRQLLAFSRKQILHPEPFDANDMIRGMHSMLARLIGEDVELEMRLAVLSGFAVADQNQIEQVIINLAVNARDAMPRGGHLVLETSRVEIPVEREDGTQDLSPGPYVVMSVIDTGTGIPPEQLGLIFEPFYTTKEKGKGTGLGLPTAYGVLRQSGGTITVQSSVGKGSTFRVYLPLSEGAGPLPAVTGATRPGGGSETVLIAEDEEPVRTFAERVFREHGYTVITAPSGEEALRLAAGHPGAIDLLITDVVMPGMGGRELSVRLNQLRPGLKVLHVSGYNEDAILRRGVLEEGVRFLAKPYTASVLLDQARRLLDG